MEIQHFLHEHPLTLLTLEERDEKGRIMCRGCREDILRNDPMYTCKKCSYYDLHKSCAEQPSKAERYTYVPPIPQPPPKKQFGASDHGNLTLIRATDVCIVCKDYFEGKLMYVENNERVLTKPNQTQKRVLFCVNCARLNDTIEHTSHNHPLNLQRKKSTFTCDACNREEAGRYSYHCASCSFWISEHCSSLPNTLQHTSHDHPLTLVGLFRLDEYLTRFMIYCDICGKWVNEKNCAYYCAHCRFYSHIGCATTRSIENEARSHDTEAVHMPPPDRSGYLDMVTRLIEQLSFLRSDEGGSRSGQCTSDKHYIVFDAPSNEICDCCVQPVCAPYYDCPECQQILHKSCGDLPSQIDHPLHADHPLTLVNPSFFDCSSCGVRCTGFAFHCAICSFYIDIKCSSLPTTIKHEAHKHLLSLQKLAGQRCFGCPGYFLDKYKVAYACTANCNFILHLDCALLPRTLTHKYDKHALTLMYKPVGIISNVYYCEICEGEVNTRQWFYYCSTDCDYSFHPSCIGRNAQIIHNKVKMGAKIISDLHPCQLTTFTKRKLIHGRVNIYYDLLECKECKFEAELSEVSMLGPEKTKKIGFQQTAQTRLKQLMWSWNPST